MTSVRTAILASGEGTTAEAFIRAAHDGLVDSDVVVVICNKPDAGIFARIERLNQELGLSVKTTLINAQTHPAVVDETLVRGGQTRAEEEAILALLAEERIELVLLMGYLRRVGPRLVREYGWRDGYTDPHEARMLNTHPGLLPATEGLWGLHVQKHVIDEDLAEAGPTLHVVAEKYDDGPVLAEHRLAVERGETAQALFERVKTLEKLTLPADVQAFIMGRKKFMSEAKKNR